MVTVQDRPPIDSSTNSPCSLRSSSESPNPPEKTTLYDAKTGREVGTAFGRGIFIDIENNNPLFGFNATNKLEGGEIDTQGAARESEFDAGFTAAIIGGTGVFARARGTVTIRAIGDTVQFTFDLLP